MSLKGDLFTEKQYKKCLIIIINLLLISGIITLAGFGIAIIADNANAVIAGIIVSLVGFVLLMISIVYVFKNSVKATIVSTVQKEPRRL